MALGFPFPGEQRTLPPVRRCFPRPASTGRTESVESLRLLRAGRRPARPRLRPCLAAAGVACQVLGQALAAEAAGSAGPSNSRSTSLSATDAERVGSFAAACFRQETVASNALPAGFGLPPAVVYVAARARGERLAATWREAPTGEAALREALATLRRTLKPAEQTRVATLEINLAYGFTPVNPALDTNRLSNVHRGLRGLQLVHRGTAHRLAPTEMIAQNLSFERALERLAERAGIEPWQAGGPEAPLSLFEADQLLVDLGGPRPTTTVLYRGNTVVPIEAITQPAIQRLREALAQWMSANLQPDGRMTYLYWPSRGEESSGNNEGRQWVATVALTRLGRACADQALPDRTVHSLRFNLSRSFREDPAGHGLIFEGEDKVKLGALAVACLALVEHPERARFAREEMALRRTIEALWLPHGEFRTFWLPAGLMDQVNFYPGEALLLWTTLLRESGDPTLEERILKSLRFYRAWHRTQRNPAFIPWHTQAYYLLYQVSPAREIRDWIFEMNDWLLGVQQWETQTAFPDTMGRFYDPDRPFGPPHASSTGVYLEGLIDAWRLARETADGARQEQYRQAIVRGLRSITQLTFLDEVDLFYVSKPARVFGGVRTTVYDNSIRVDNVQHNLMAILKILEYFGAEDFRP